MFCASLVSSLTQIEYWQFKERAARTGAGETSPDAPSNKGEESPARQSPSRFNFLREARIWYARELAQQTISDESDNVIVLSDEFYGEIVSHPVPTDLDAVKALTASPGLLDLFMWLSYRCFVSKGEERIPIFGPFGLVAQLGTGDYSRPRRLRQRLEQWLDTIRVMWPGCPARISSDGDCLIVAPGCAVLTRPASLQKRALQYVRSRA